MAAEEGVALGESGAVVVALPAAATDVSAVCAATCAAALLADGFAAPAVQLAVPLALLPRESVLRSVFAPEMLAELVLTASRPRRSVAEPASQSDVPARPRSDSLASAALLGKPGVRLLV